MLGKWFGLGYMVRVRFWSYGEIRVRVRLGSV